MRRIMQTYTEFCGDWAEEVACLVRVYLEDYGPGAIDKKRQRSARGTDFLGVGQQSVGLCTLQPPPGISEPARWRPSSEGGRGGGSLAQVLQRGREQNVQRPPQDRKVETGGMENGETARQADAL